MKTRFTTDTKLESEIAYFENINLKIESGDIIDSFKLAFKTFGKLNTDKTNAILVCHAFSGNHHVAGDDKELGTGWWDQIVGPDKALDTNKYFVVCCNNLGGCAGSSGLV